MALPPIALNDLFPNGVSEDVRTVLDEAKRGGIGSGYGKIQGPSNVVFGQPAPAADPNLAPAALTSFPDQMEGGQDQTEGALAVSAFDNDVYKFRHGPQGPGNEVMPEGLDFNVVGPDGKSDFQRAFGSGPDDGPAKVSSAIDAGAMAESDRNKALQEHYTGEQQRQTMSMATIEARRQSDDRDNQRRQAELDKAVSYYSNDLANQNKFWQNPGNIVSAIAFSLMPIAGGDPAMGAKLIQQAVNQDMANRKDLADMHLGALRSNLGEYRKMAGDRRVGDLLAESEAKRIVAMDIERIAAQYQSPIALAKAETLKQNFLMQSVQAKMAAFQAYHIYKAPQAVDPRIAAQYRNAGPGGLAAYASMNGEGTGGKGPGAVKGTLPNGSPTTASAAFRGGHGPVGPDGKPGPTTAQKPKAYDLHSIMQSRGVASPKELLAQQAQDVENEAAATTKPGDSIAFNKAVQQIKAKDEADAKVIGEQYKVIAPKSVGLRRLERDMNLIEEGARAAGVQPQEFIGNFRAYVGGSMASRIRNIQQSIVNTNPGTKVAKEAQERMDAQERFHNLLAGQIMDYYHSRMGSAQSPSETGRGIQVIDAGSSWGKIRNWNKNQSQIVQGEIQAAFASAGNPRAATRFQLGVGIGTPTMSTKGANGR